MKGRAEGKQLARLVAGLERLLKEHGSHAVLAVLDEAIEEIAEEVALDGVMLVRGDLMEARAAISRSRVFMMRVEERSPKCSLERGMQLYRETDYGVRTLRGVRIDRAAAKREADAVAKKRETGVCSCGKFGCHDTRHLANGGGQ